MISPCLPYITSSYVRRDVFEDSKNEDISEIALSSTLLPADFNHLQQSNHDVESSVQTEFQSLLQLRDKLLQRQEDIGRIQPIIQKDSEKDMFVPIREYESWIRGSDLVEPVVMELLEMKKKREEEELSSSVNQEKTSVSMPAAPIPATPTEGNVIKVEEEHEQVSSNPNVNDKCIPSETVYSPVDPDHISTMIKQEEGHTNSSNKSDNSGGRPKRSEFDLRQVDSEYRDGETTELPEPPSNSLLDSILFVLQRSLKKEKQKITPAGGEDDLIGEEKENGSEDEMNTCSHGLLDPICRYWMM